MRRWRLAKAFVMPIFKNTSCVLELTPAQEHLLEWLEFYDRIRNSDDPPSERTIRNNESLDKWVKVKKSEYRDYLMDLKRSRKSHKSGTISFHEHYEPG